jgi:hypothetical protein
MGADEHALRLHMQSVSLHDMTLHLTCSCMRTGTSCFGCWY